MMEAATGPVDNGHGNISHCMQDREAIEQRIKYFKDELALKQKERKDEYDRHGVSSKYKSLSNRMSSIKADIRKWQSRLDNFT